jgi:uncharacterized protein YecE (DUF72 family)
MSPIPLRSARSIDRRSTPAAGVARIGCSGWHYKSWRGIVYPPALPPAAWLRDYARRLHTVELNNSFYRLPAPETFAGWRKQVPRGFVFAVKASRFLTHIKRLRDPDEPVTRLLTHARLLGPALGPILYQVPPRWFPDRDRLETFLAALPDRPAPRSRHRLRHVLEMRDPRGYEPWVIDLLREYDVSLCVHDMPGSESPLVAVGAIVYVRLHGYGVKYGGTYPQDILEEWATWLRSALASGHDAYVYFNNDINGYAVHDAQRLRALLEGRAQRAVATPLRAPERGASPYPPYPVPRRGSPIASSSAGDSTDEPL